MIILTLAFIFPILFYL